MNRRAFLLTAAAGALAPQPGPRMLTRPIPRTKEPLPVVGLGTWQTFDPPRVTPEVKGALVATLRALVDAGGRVIDSSPMYGESERNVGDLAEPAGVA